MYINYYKEDLIFLLMVRGVAGIVNYEGKILVGKKKSDSPNFLAGKWNIPGETIEGDESEGVALIRGMKEEANLELIVGSYIGTSTSQTSKMRVNWYQCYSRTDKISYSSDLEDAKWIDKKEILNFISKEVVDLWPKEIIDYFKV